MATAFIESLKVKNFGCVKEVDVKLTPLHAFIGPNDSGKSTLLLATKAVVEASSKSGHRNGSGIPIHGKKVLPFGSITENRTKNTDVSIRYCLSNGLVEYSMIRNPDDQDSELLYLDNNLAPDNLPNIRLNPIQDELYRNWLKISGVRLVRFDPDALRKPSKLIPDNEIVDFKDERGFRLPGVYDAIRNRGDENYWNIVKDIKKLFPTIEKVQLRNEGPDLKSLGIELNNGQSVSAEFLSEGLLYYLAFAAIPYLSPTSLLLVEEPENGLHPARIKDIMQVLREISKKTQVLIATHSPLVINELQGNEVTVVTRDKDKGTETIALSETPNFEERSKVYALGELWVSYANGDDEKPLLTGSEHI
jgi:predicted ATPase